MKKERALQIKTPSGWKVAGKIIKINGKWCFYREVSKSKHAFYTFDVWSIQASLIPILEKDCIEWFYNYDKQSGKMYRIRLDDFINKSVVRDFGEGEQLYVSTKYFEEVDMKPIKKWVKEIELVA